MDGLATFLVLSLPVFRLTVRFRVLFRMFFLMTRAYDPHFFAPLLATPHFFENLALTLSNLLSSGDRVTERARFGIMQTVVRAIRTVGGVRLSALAILAHHSHKSGID